MPNFSLIVTGLAAIASASPLESRFANSYKFYTGDGSAKAGWPAISAWGSYDQMWNTNLPLIQQACANNGGFANNSPAETQSIKDAVKLVSGETGVDERFILAIIMQESKGCVRIKTTVSPDGRVINRGLMQSHNGAGTCFQRNPCPASAITQMIRDGTAGTSTGDGLKQVLATAQRSTGGGSRMYYAAARIYNSGSANFGNLGDGKGATNCYASDVANRFTGWTLAPSQCRA
ncbi:hypothetical protein PWT90_07259 [Aphanocladium album]|nr:hypothetical protein PWT90_07259 [Aphanocladium album]